MTNARGTALFRRSNAPVTISTIPIIGKNILVLAKAPKKAPASGPTSGIGANCKSPFNPKKSRNMLKIIRSTVFEFFISNVFNVKRIY